MFIKIIIFNIYYTILSINFAISSILVLINITNCVLYKIIIIYLFIS